MNDAETETKPVTARQAGVKIFGIGGAGLNILKQLESDGIPPATLIAIHSELAELSQCQAAEEIHFENKVMRASSSGSNGAPKGPAEDLLSRVKSLCSGEDIVFIAAGLGGNLGMSLSPAVAAAARE